MKLQIFFSLCSRPKTFDKLLSIVLVWLYEHWKQFFKSTGYCRAVFVWNFPFTITVIEKFMKR